MTIAQTWARCQGQCPALELHHKTVGSGGSGEGSGDGHAIAASDRIRVDAPAGGRRPPEQDEDLLAVKDAVVVAREDDDLPAARLGPLAAAS